MYNMRVNAIGEGDTSHSEHFPVMFHWLPLHLSDVSAQNVTLGDKEFYEIEMHMTLLPGSSQPIPFQIHTLRIDTNESVYSEGSYQLSNIS